MSKWRLTKRAAGLALNATSIGADFEPSDEDVMLVSYPRSGNTWARFLLANLMVGPHEVVSFSNLESLVPDIYQNTLRSLRMHRAAGPRVIKSHEAFCARYHRVVYIVRDPRDVAVSYYNYHLKKREIPPSVTLDEYVSGLVEGSWDQFGTWGDHVGSWLGARNGAASFLLVRYEDLRREPTRELSRLASFVGVKAEVGALQRAVSRSRFDAMQKAEATTASRWATVRGSRDDIPFVRRGRVGEGSEALSQHALTAIEVTWGVQMGLCGYPSTPRLTGEGQR